MSKRELRFATLLRIGEAAWVPYSSASAGFVGWVTFRAAALPGSGLPVDVLVAPCRFKHRGGDRFRPPQAWTRARALPLAVDEPWTIREE